MVPSLPAGTKGAQTGWLGTLNNFTDQLSKNPLTAPYEAFTGQMPNQSGFRDIIIYSGAGILLLVAVIGILR